MKKIIIIFTILLIQISVSASECTEYLSNIYSKNYNTEVKITGYKTEYTDKYEDYINNQFISSIQYRRGYLKQPDKRRQKISYLCTLKDHKTIT